MDTPPTHQTSRLRRPTKPLLEWVADRVGSTVTNSQPLVGGMSSLIMRCELADGRQIVVRQIEDQEWLKREPTIVAQEATALRLLENSALATPRLVACDVEAGRLIMSLLSGTMQVAGDDLTSRVQAMAATAVAIATTPLPNNHGLAMYRPWLPDDIRPPTWGDQGLWSDAISLYHHKVAELGIDRVGWALGYPHPVLLHRDLHPLNMLWPTDLDSGNSKPGIVDWLNACVGHPHAELGHCRWNLAVMAGIEAADSFLNHYLNLSKHDHSSTYDSLWDLVVLLSVSSEQGALAGKGWQAVGRTDLIPPTIINSSQQFLRAVLD